MTTPHPNISVPASLIGEPTRAAMLMLLCDGRALAAGALARALQISPQSASNHLAQLVDGGLLVGVRQGRHKYYQLASPAVAQSIEALAAIAAPVSTERLGTAHASHEVRMARRCYHHLAGRLGVSLLEALQRKGYLVRTGTGATGRAEFQLSAAGERWAAALGVSTAASASRGAVLGQACIDWTERREHLSGALATALLRRIEELGYVRAGRGRALHLTPEGTLFFQREFDIAPPVEPDSH